MPAREQPVRSYLKQAFIAKWGGLCLPEYLIEELTLQKRVDLR